MGKELRNIVLGALLALPAGYQTLIAYNQYRVPEVLAIENRPGVKITTYRYQYNALFEAVDKILGKSINHDSVVIGKEIRIDLTIPEIDKKTISKDWSAYKRNASLKKGNPRWDPQKQAVYNALAGIAEGNISDEYFNGISRSIRLHEFYHNKAREEQGNNKKSLTQKELEAYSYSLTQSPFVLDDLEGLIRGDKRGANRDAASIILKKLYGDDPWAFYHDPNFRDNLKKKSNAIFTELKEKSS